MGMESIPKNGKDLEERAITKNSTRTIKMCVILGVIIITSRIFYGIIIITIFRITSSMNFLSSRMVSIITNLLINIEDRGDKY